MTCAKEQQNHNLQNEKYIVLGFRYELSLVCGTNFIAIIQTSQNVCAFTCPLDTAFKK